MTTLTNNSYQTLSESEINLLPSFLREGKDFFRTPHEKTIFAFSALSACGALLTRSSGVYYQRRIYPNLFFILLANAASGKSSLSCVYDLLQPIHKEILEKSLKEREIQEVSKGKETSNRKPGIKTVLIPGNVSGSRLLQHLNENQPSIPSVVVETELDTLTQANKSDFGGFSDVLRRAFHNEKLSYSRKGGDEFIEVDKPKLSLILSGTPKQIFKLIPSAEDGLYSRCAIYTFSQDAKWMDVSPVAGNIDMNEAMLNLSLEFYNFWKFFNDRDVEFRLSQLQWQKLNDYFGTCLEEAASIDGNASLSVVKRHAVICFKLCMILSAIRSYEFGIKENVFECYDQDFHTAMALSKISLSCSLRVLEHLPDGEQISKRQERRELYRQQLPDAFHWKEALDLAKTMKISERSVDRWLNKWCCEGLFANEGHGVYSKVL